MLSHLSYTTQDHRSRKQYLPLVAYWALLHPSRKYLVEMSTDPLDKDNYSTETIFYQMIEGYFKLVVNVD